MKKARKCKRKNEAGVTNKNLFLMILIGFFISFGGWIFETVAHYVIHSEFGDRGFLTLPFCPIYGTSIVLISYLLGTPQDLDGILEKKMMRLDKFKKALKNKMLRVIIYFITVTLLSTLAELIIGVIFKLLGMPLWDYSEKPFNLFGVVCLSYSLLWGAMITVFMALCWRPVEKLFSKIPKRTAFIASLTLLVAALIDFIVNLFVDL